MERKKETKVITRKLWVSELDLELIETRKQKYCFLFPTIMEEMEVTLGK